MNLSQRYNNSMVSGCYKWRQTPKFTNITKKWHRKEELQKKKIILGYHGVKIYYLKANLAFPAVFFLCPIAFDSHDMPVCNFQPNFTSSGPSLCHRELLNLFNAFWMAVCTPERSWKAKDNWCWVNHHWGSTRMISLFPKTWDIGFPQAPHLLCAR